MCQGIRYEIDAELGEILYCHCQRCRKANGTAFATNAPVPVEKFTWLQGEHLLKNTRLRKQPSAVFVEYAALQSSVLKPIRQIFTGSELVH